jgi:hypothetical protein
MGTGLGFWGKAAGVESKIFPKIGNADPENPTGSSGSGGHTILPATDLLANQRD